ncbi:restriction endonuclease subunit S [Chryseolinea sp. T2]|uniref:restriction endonuclease subunit S n=1 Tax=Chryseolinea sp. T2 TaxID=3129255 RepID=UPI003076F597
MGLIFDEPLNPQCLSIDLKMIAKSHSLRCDAKQAQDRFLKFDAFINSIESFEVGDVLPNPIIKGIQPSYIEEINVSGVPVVNTLAIQNMQINVSDCRFITEEDFDSIDEERKCRQNDILLTVDGGTSIGKAVLFSLEGDFTIDSHVSILRPVGIKPVVLVYLLASPMGQIQFKRAESGASGQTAVTEEDIRRFRFPLVNLNALEKEVNKMDKMKKQVEFQKSKLDSDLATAWLNFNDKLAGK